MKVKITVARRFPNGQTLYLFFFNDEAAGMLTLWPHELTRIVQALRGFRHKVYLLREGDEDSENEGA